MEVPLADRLRETERDALAEREDDDDRLADGVETGLAPKVADDDGLAARVALTERLTEFEGDTERVTVGLKPV